MPFITLGADAEGSIGVSSERENLYERLEEFTDRVAAGEFHVATDIRLPCGCMDGRCGCNKVRPNTAGGTLTFAVVADILGDDEMASRTMAEIATNVVGKLSAHEYPVGVHTAEELHGEQTSGCGANDKLATIYRIMYEKADVLRELATAFHINVHNDDHAAIVAGAQRRTAFSSGAEVFTAASVQMDSSDIDTLRGAHNEVLVTINHRVGTTLDREAVRAEFGDDYQSFNVDAWSFEAGARALYHDADDATIARAVTAMVYYNLATALALCGSNMRVTILE